MSTDPFELLVAQFTISLAPVGESFPDLDSAAAGNWTALGTTGPVDYSEEGISVELSQVTNPIRSYGSTGIRKMLRSEEDVKLTVTLQDVTMEALTEALNRVAAADTAAGSGTVGYQSLNLLRGHSVAEFALLARAVESPYYDVSTGDWGFQYELFRCVQVGSPTIVHVKDNVPALALEFQCLEDPAQSTDLERYGRFVISDATST